MNRTIIIYSILGLLVVVLVFLIWLFQRPKSNTLIKQNTPTISPSFPNSEISRPAPSKISSVTPTLIPPQFTGALDVTIPQPTIDASNQRQELRRKTPLKEGAFTINFDYAGDKFTVNLNDPKDTSKASFDSWVKQFYPEIPLSNFIFQ